MVGSISSLVSPLAVPEGGCLPPPGGKWGRERAKEAESWLQMGRASSGRGGDTVSHPCFPEFVRNTLTTTIPLGSLWPLISLARASSFCFWLVAWDSFAWAVDFRRQTPGFFLLRSLCPSKQSSWSKSSPHCLSHYLRLVFRGCKLLPLPESLPCVQATFCQRWPFRFLRHEPDNGPWRSPNCRHHTSSSQSLSSDSRWEKSPLRLPASSCTGGPLGTLNNSFHRNPSSAAATSTLVYLQGEWEVKGTLLLSPTWWFCTLSGIWEWLATIIWGHCPSGNNSSHLTFCHPMFSHWLSNYPMKFSLIGCFCCVRLFVTHGLQLPCPSLAPGVCPNSYPLSQRCHPTISSSVAPFSSCPQSFPASGSFPTSRVFLSGGQSRCW